MKLRDKLMSLILFVLFLGALWYIQKNPYSGTPADILGSRRDSVQITRAYATAYAFETLNSPGTQVP